MRQINFKSLLQIKQLTYEAYFVPSCSDEFMFCLGVCCFYVLFSHEMLILMFVDKRKIVLQKFLPTFLYNCKTIACIFSE